MLQAAPIPADAHATLAVQHEVAEALVASDLPLVLVKAGRAERALVRRQLILSGTLQLTVDPPPAVVRTCRWRFQLVFTRQVCFSSMTGLFSCTDPTQELEPDIVEGRVALSTRETEAACSLDLPGASKARSDLAARAATRAPGRFSDDMRLKLAPVFRAAGVTVRSDLPKTEARSGGRSAAPAP